MIENRRIRFNDMDGLDRSDLPLAAEIWLETVCGGRWSSAEVQKVAAILAGWVRDPSLAEAEHRAIEDKYRLTREEVSRAFSLLKLFGFIEAFTVDREGVKAALKLGTLIKIRVIETRQRYRDLIAAAEASADSRWLPQEASSAETEPCESEASALEPEAITGKAA